VIRNCFVGLFKVYRKIRQRGDELYRLLKSSFPLFFVIPTASPQKKKSGKTEAHANSLLFHNHSEKSGIIYL